ncbi:MAG: hypothetical protein KF893_13655 [Caldilineaceae bacterium]|nr:hypothetical protein [Caldilineaceae bacterium]
MTNPEISVDELTQIRNAIQQVRSKIEWKAGKDLSHLRTRINYGHLPASATISAYEAIIQFLIADPSSDVYVYRWQHALYPTVVGKYQEALWLVMFGLSGLMETAFPPSDPERYLADPRFEYVGVLQEILT